MLMNDCCRQVSVGYISCDYVKRNNNNKKSVTVNK